MNLKFGIPCWSQRVRLSDQWRGEADVHVSTVANCHSTLDLLTTEYPVYIQARVAGDFCIFLFCSIVKSMVNLEWPTKTTLQMVERNAARDVCFSNLVISHVHEAHLYIRRSWLAGHCFFFSKDFFFRSFVSMFVVCNVCLHPNFELTSGTPLKTYPTLGHMVPEFPCLWFSFFLFPQIEAPLERLANLWTCLTCWYLLGIGGYFHAVLPTKCTPSKFWSGLSALCICLDYIRGSCYILLSQIETIIRSYCKVDRCFWCLGPSRNLFISITCLGQVVNTTFVGATPGKATWGLSPIGVWNASVAVERGHLLKMMVGKIDVFLYEIVCSPCLYH